MPAPIPHNAGNANNHPLRHKHLKYRFWRRTDGSQYTDLTRLVEEDIGKSDVPIDKHKIAAHYLAGALFDVMTWWIDSRCSLAPQELESQFIELSVPVVDSLLVK